MKVLAIVTECGYLKPHAQWPSCRTPVRLTRRQPRGEKRAEDTKSISLQELSHSHCDKQFNRSTTQGQQNSTPELLDESRL